jgi:hypothetical protein
MAGEQEMWWAKTLLQTVIPLMGQLVARGVCRAVGKPLAQLRPHLANTALVDQRSPSLIETLSSKVELLGRMALVNGVVNMGVYYGRLIVGLRFCLGLATAFGLAGFLDRLQLPIPTPAAIANA